MRNRYIHRVRKRDASHDAPRRQTHLLISAPNFGNLSLTGRGVIFLPLRPSMWIFQPVTLVVGAVP